MRIIKECKRREISKSTGILQKTKSEYIGGHLGREIESAGKKGYPREMLGLASHASPSISLNSPIMEPF